MLSYSTQTCPSSALASMGLERGSRVKPSCEARLQSIKLLLAPESMEMGTGNTQ